MLNVKDLNVILKHIRERERGENIIFYPSEYTDKKGHIHECNHVEYWSNRTDSAHRIYRGDKDYEKFYDYDTYTEQEIPLEASNSIKFLSEIVRDEIIKREEEILNELSLML